LHGHYYSLLGILIGPIGQTMQISLPVYTRVNGLFPIRCTGNATGTTVLSCSTILYKYYYNNVGDMIKLSSLKTKSIAFTPLIVLVPLIILGIAGTLYYGDVIRHGIQNDYLGDARMVAQLMANYLDRALFFIEGQAHITPLVTAVDRQDLAALDD
jgi:hypothetical protein